MNNDQSDMSFAPLDRNRAEEVDLLINEAVQKDSILVVDPDKGIQGVGRQGDISPDDSVVGVRRFDRFYRGR